MIDTPITRKKLSSYYSEITYMDSLFGKTIEYIEEANKQKIQYQFLLVSKDFLFHLENGHVMIWGLKLHL